MRCAVQTPRDARSLLEAAYEEADRVKIGVGDFTASLPDEDRQRMSALSASQGAFAWTYGEVRLPLHCLLWQPCEIPVWRS